MRFCSLASGSRGNATFVSTASTRILLDCGISVAQLSRRLLDINEHLGAIDAVLISHEHLDHCSGLTSLRRIHNFKGWVYVEKAVAEAAEPERSSTVKFEKVHHFQRGVPFRVGDIEVRPFDIPHDAIAPAGFMLTSGMSRVAVVTDLGHIPHGFGELLAGTDILLLESNHDTDMLQACHYASYLRQRILGDRGHLSNDQVSDFICDGLLYGTPRLVLGHISENSNDPRLVHLLASNALKDRGLNADLTVIESGCGSNVFEL